MISYKRLYQKLEAVVGGLLLSRTAINHPPTSDTQISLTPTITQFLNTSEENISTAPTLTLEPTEETSPLECGGKRGIMCPEGYRCDKPAGVKDGLGICVK